jgi:hypothetical protein
MRGFGRDAPKAENGFVLGRIVSSTLPRRHIGGESPIISASRCGASERLIYGVKKSAHFCTFVSAAPQGMIGTVEVEFFGEPSMILSE